MKDSHYRISLDIHSTQSQVSLPVKQGDTSRKVFISLCEGGKPYQIEKDCYAVLSARKPDGTLIENYCIIAGNVIEYTFTEQTTAVGGMLNCEIKLYGGDSGLITSPRFTIIVDTRVVSDAEVESYSEYLALTNLYTITNSAASNANAKAELANATAENANAKAVLANTAASNANAAAENANAKAELANAAAENANAVAKETEALKTEVETKLANGEFKGEKGDKGDPGKDVDYNLVSNALKGSASGNQICLNDVSPLEHEIAVRVDVAGATIRRYGKNHCSYDVEKWLSVAAKQYGFYIVGSTLYGENASGMAHARYLQTKLPKGTYTASASFDGYSRYLVRLCKKDGTIITDEQANFGTYNSYYGGYYFNGLSSITFTIPDEADHWYLGVVFYSSTDNGLMIPISNLLLVTGDGKTVLEYTADESGKVNDIIYNGEDMTLAADDGVTIVAEYNLDTKKYIDKKIAELQALILEV